MQINFGKIFGNVKNYSYICTTINFNILKTWKNNH